MSVFFRLNNAAFHDTSYLYVVPCLRPGSPWVSLYSVNS